MSWILFILFGFVIGLLARALMPGRQKLGLVKTTLLGIAGSLLGGFIGMLISGAPSESMQPAGFLGSLLGALAVLAIYIAATRRRLSHV
jgi:uncharacterized membrane protein YeaQ/YmgE (transglycosylase-associated protein family)